MHVLNHASSSLMMRFYALMQERWQQLAVQDLLPLSLLLWVPLLGRTVTVGRHLKLRRPSAQRSEVTPCCHTLQHSTHAAEEAILEFVQRTSSCDSVLPLGLELRLSAGKLARTAPGSSGSLPTIGCRQLPQRACAACGVARLSLGLTGLTGEGNWIAAFQSSRKQGLL